MENKELNEASWISISKFLIVQSVGASIVKGQFPNSLGKSTSCCVHEDITNIRHYFRCAQVCSSIHVSCYLVTKNIEDIEAPSIFSGCFSERDTTCEAVVTRITRHVKQ